MRRHFCFALLLSLADSLVLGSGLIAGILVLVVVVQIIGAFVFKKINRYALKVNAVYLSAVVVITIGNLINFKIAESRAESIIAACEKYKEHYGKYPEQLSELVPEYLRDVPSAKYTLFENQFFYLARGKDHSLVYSVIPLGKRSYYFELRRWRID